MAKVCPITNTKVVYLACQECDEKLCRQPALKAADSKRPQRKEEQQTNFVVKNNQPT